MAKTKQMLEEAKDFSSTGKKLNEFIEEEVEVNVVEPVISQDGKTSKVSFKTVPKIVQQKTYYSQSEPKTLICSKHFYIPENLKKYIFRCQNCEWHFQARVIIHKYKPETGELIVRSTGRVLP